MRNIFHSIATLLTFCLLAGTGLLSPTGSASAPCDQPAWFAPATLQAVGTRTNRVELADLNGDGILDLVACQSEAQDGGVNNTIAVMLGGGSGGIGDGTFGPPQFHTVGPHPVGIAIADFDGDGHLDLVVTTMGDSKVWFLHGLGVESH